MNTGTDSPEGLGENLIDDPSIPPEEVVEQKIHQRVEEMFNTHRERLLRMIDIRLRSELRQQVDPADILQEAFMEAYRQLKNGISEPKGSDLVWLRLIVAQQMIAFHRKYFQAQKRNVAREVSIYNENKLTEDMTRMSSFLIGKMMAPSVATRRQELIMKVQACLEELNPTDRQILALRHFEQLSNAETAEELNISPNTASVRYLRALRKFRDLLVDRHLDDLLE